jgi:hypothetical protein
MLKLRSTILLLAIMRLEHLILSPNPGRESIATPAAAALACVLVYHWYHSTLVHRRRGGTAPPAALLQVGFVGFRKLRV